VGIDPVIVDRIASAVSRQRLTDTALALCSIYSPTGEAGEVSDRLAELLASDGFHLERPVAGWPAAPAVVARLKAGRPGRVLQFDGHLDTVHLPFVPPTIAGDRLTGSGSIDMKGGVAAAVEALRAVRDSGLLSAGEILFTAHDLHEAPWGDGSQLERLIDQGCVGDAVLIPEYLRDVLAISGRGQATFKICLARSGPTVHEVLRPDEPNVIAAGAQLVARLMEWDQQLAQHRDEHAGCESVFIGQFHSGEIFNQYPAQCRLEGTRRWLPRQSADEVEADFRRRVEQVAAEAGVGLELEYLRVRDAFYLDPTEPIVGVFQSARQALGEPPLPIGGKRFVDDGNTFWSRARVPAITHGPSGGSPHTLDEWVPIDELVRVARLYALVAVVYCQQGARRLV
jgi:succinyl-diaminopimelate desuccinylase